MDKPKFAFICAHTSLIAPEKSKFLSFGTGVRCRARLKPARKRALRFTLPGLCRRWHFPASDAQSQSNDMAA